MFAVLIGCALSLLAVAILWRPRLLRPRFIDEVERRQVTANVRSTIELTGGDDVWVKSPPFVAFPPPRPLAPAEAVVATARFEAVIAAVQARGQADNLHAVTQIARDSPHGRRAEIRFMRGRAHAGRWILREVPRIRHAVIVVDDLGQDLSVVRQLIALPCPLTVAILPHLAHSRDTAEEAHRAGREVMLHLPMEPDSSARPGPGEIRVGMRGAEVERLVGEDLDSVPFAAGVNNHMGSKASTNKRLMEELMKTLARRQLFFIDSRTTPHSVALDVARRRDVPAFFRSVFLDDVETVSYTLGQIHELIRIVEEQDVAVAIGHPYPTTLDALAQTLPELERRGIRLVPASELLRRPEVTRLAPPRLNAEKAQRVRGGT